MRRIKWFLLLIGFVFANGCDDDGVITVQDMATADLSQIDATGLDISPPDLASVPVAIVTSRDELFTEKSGAINSVSLRDKTVKKAIDTNLDTDTVIHVVGTDLMIMNRISNQILIYKNFDFTTKPVPTIKLVGAYPQDFLAIPNSTKIYVSFLGDGTHDVSPVAVYDSAQTVQTPEAISIEPAPGDTGDKSPEANSLYYCKGLIYVALQNLDQTDFKFTAVGKGRIGVIDPSKPKEEQVTVFSLQYENPAGIFSAGDDCEKVWVAGGVTKFEPDQKAGLEKVDLKLKTSEPILDGSMLHAVPTGVAQASPTSLFVSLLYDLQTKPFTQLSRAKVVIINPEQKKVVIDVGGPVSFIGTMKLSPDGQLWFSAANNLTSEGKVPEGNIPAGLYVRQVSGALTQTQLLDIGQVPVSIDFH